jgi:hypothetical protein
MLKIGDKVAIKPWNNYYKKYDSIGIIIDIYGNTVSVNYSNNSKFLLSTGQILRIVILCA